MQNGNPNEIRRKKIIALVSVLVVAGILIVFVLIPDLVKNNQAKANYSKALDLMNSGQYQAAAEKFEECGDYNDAQDLARQCYYAQAERLFKNNNYNDYEQAADFYQKAGSYSNAPEQYSECMYQIGSARMEQGDISGAGEAFMKAGIDYKDVKRYICSSAALSQEFSFSLYSLEDRIEDYLYYTYGESVIGISGDGLIRGHIHGHYYLMDDSELQVYLCAEDGSGGTMEQIIDTFICFIRYVYGIENSDVNNRLSEIKQYEYGSFYLSEEDELMAKTWSESGYVILEVKTVPLEMTRMEASLQGKGQIVVDAINRETGENVVALQYVSNDEQDVIYIELLSCGDLEERGTCTIRGTYDTVSDVFTIGEIGIWFDVGTTNEPKAYFVEEFSNVEKVVCGIIEGLFGLPIDSATKEVIKNDLATAAEEWYGYIVEDGGRHIIINDRETETFRSNPAGLHFEFNVWSNQFMGDIECSGYSF